MDPDETLLLDTLISSIVNGEVIDSISSTHLEKWKLLLDVATRQSEVGDPNLLLKIVSIVSTTISPSNSNNETLSTPVEEKLGHILAGSCGHAKFLNSLMIIVTTWSKDTSNHEKLGKLLVNLHIFCSGVLKRLPYLGKDVLLNLICVCIGVSASTASLLTAHPEIIGEFSQLQRRILEINKECECEAEKKVKKDEFSNLEDLLVPPEDFREIPIVPTLQELITEERPFLRKNKTVGAYRNSEHYLDVQFRLLREDFVRPLRLGVQQFMRNREEFIKYSGRRRGNQEQDSNVRLYTDVTFRRTEKIRTEAPDFLFSLPQRLMSKINWDKSKRLLSGCLVMLTSDYCKSAIFAVTLVPPYDPNRKNSGGDSRRHELSKGILRLSIEAGSELVDPNKSYLMFECEAFFEAYRYNLGILQTMLFLENDGPQRNSLNKFIVGASSVVEFPLYLTNTEVEFRLPIEDVDDQDVQHVSPFLHNKWPSEEIQQHMSLDADQYEAFNTALTSELAVIQGPPGTGKTYVGLQIVKTLLLNKKEDLIPPKSPFLVLCYTNHALDQFLELLLKEMPKLTVARVGGQSKSEVLEYHTLARHRRRILDHNNYARFVREQKSNEVAAFRAVKELERRIARLKLEIIGLSNPTGIFLFQTMVVGGRVKEILPIDVWNTLARCSEWLGLGIRSELFSTLDFHVGEIMSHFFVVRPKAKVVANQRSTPEEIFTKKETFTKDNHSQEGENQEEFEYDMDELMEHRMVEMDDYFECKPEEKHNDVNSDIDELLYFINCSVRQCFNLIDRRHQEWNNACSRHEMLMKKMTKKNIKLKVPEQMEMLRLTNQIRKLRSEKIEYENRAKLFSTIFGLHKEERLEFRDVEKAFYKDADTDEYVVNGSISQYPVRLKWGIYFKIVEIAVGLAKDYLRESEESLEKARVAYAQERHKLDGCILSDADVIGMTTTGAAKMHSLLEIAKPQVVIVEEAAEILEAHIVTSLTEDCKHLILIGDHLQLRPSANIFELWKNYRLNVSLFERLILNKVPLCTLKTQHRMRPEISNLIIGPIYEELRDHPKVFEYPHVKGIKKSLFFINHSELEQVDADLASKSNQHEANFLVGLCEYLLKQGYQHQQITILTTYTGQMFLVKKLIPPSCRGVRITCVDNFQGEENDIILLSLVRSNKEEKVGFVGIDNRICVALSRAKHGLYVIGNMDVMTSASKTWRKVCKKLTDGKNIINSLELICERHGKITEVKARKDFGPLKLGGCHQICNAELQCSHKCPQLCHAQDQNHENYNCRERCLKTCSLNHQCIGTCSKPCPPCMIPVMKKLLCGHQEIIPCFKDVTTVQCKVPVLKTLLCQFKHELELKCFQDEATFKCQVLVEKQLPCGHARMAECDLSPDEVKCDIPEEKELPCGHKRKMKCYQPVDAFKCDEMLEKKLPCGHMQTLKCYRSVADVWCNVERDVVINGCFHVQKLPCSNSSNAKCMEKCGTTLSCGHGCTLTCHVNKDPAHDEYKCKRKCERICGSGHPCGYPHDCFKSCPPCKTSVTVSFGCGHTIDVECSEKDNREQSGCNKRVKKDLPCGHKQSVFCRTQPEKHKCTFQIGQCEKKCDLGHHCSFQHACYERCPPCVEKTLKCGHNAFIQCHNDGKGGVCSTCDKETSHSRQETTNHYVPPSRRRLIISDPRSSGPNHMALNEPIIGVRRGGGRGAGARRSWQSQPTKQRFSGAGGWRK